MASKQKSLYEIKSIYGNQQVLTYKPQRFYVVYLNIYTIPAAEVCRGGPATITAII
jgi:hypothetical protein